MTKTQLKEHFFEMVTKGDIEEVLKDERFIKIAEPYLDNPSVFIDLYKNRRYRTVVFMAICYIIKPK